MFPITKLAGKKTFLSRVRLVVVAPLRLASQTAEVTVDVKHDTTSKEPLPFDEIPGPRGKLLTGIDFYRYSEGFRKHHKLSVRLFNEYGPIFKEHVLRETPVVHVMEPDDFEKVYRAEGKYPKRDPLDFLEDCRKKKNKPKGLESMWVPVIFRRWCFVLLWARHITFKFPPRLCHSIHSNPNPNHLTNQ